MIATGKDLLIPVWVWAPGVLGACAALTVVWWHDYVAPRLRRRRAARRRFAYLERQWTERGLLATPHDKADRRALRRANADDVRRRRRSLRVHR